MRNENVLSVGTHNGQHRDNQQNGIPSTTIHFFSVAPMSEFVLAWRSDLRVLIGHELPMSAIISGEVDSRFMFDNAVVGAREVDRILRESVNVYPRTKHDAEATVRQIMPEHPTQFRYTIAWFY